MAQIIVIGAGAAGLATASKLFENSFHNVTILEAENRIGGRIHSTFLGEAFVDLGAEEVHGEEDNIVVQLAGDFLKSKTPLTKSQCYYSDGSKIDNDLTSEIMTFLERFCEDDRKIKKSIGECFIKRYNTILNNHENNREALKKTTEFLPLLESFFLILEGPYSWNDVVMESGSHYIDCEGDQFIGWNGSGCRSIINVLLSKFPNADFSNFPEENPIPDQIKLNKTVNKLQWKMKDKKVHVMCMDGTEYVGDFVVFTPSVGVLKKKHRDLFEPCLPAVKVEILEKIGFANVMKVALKFSRKWWTGAPFGFVWKAEDRISVESEDIKGTHLMDGVFWLTAIHWLIEAPDNDQVLIAWLTGPLTPRIEKLNDNCIKDGVMYAIRMFLSKDFLIPEPDQIIPTRWHSNPNFCGTYSYETVEASNLQVPFQNILEEPLKNDQGLPIVLFAGEATHLTQYSTINGAILSGFREADRIMNIYKNENSIQIS